MLTYLKLLGKNRKSNSSILCKRFLKGESMKRVLFGITLAVVLLQSGLLLADPPKANVTGPVEGYPGDFIDVDGSASTADKYLWWVDPPRYPDGRITYRVSSDGKVCQLASRPGIYKILLIVSNSEGPAFAWHTITIKGDPTNPTPNPDNPKPPPPAPPDPLPIGRFGLARMTRDLVAQNIPPDKRGPSAALSASYSVVASQIAAGTIKSLAAANVELQRRNQAAVGSDVTLWKTGVFTALSAKLGELAKAGTINTSSMDDLNAVFSEIGAGFAAGT
jgi:hypothetical protein